MKTTNWWWNMPANKEQRYLWFSLKKKIKKKINQLICINVDENIDVKPYKLNTLFKDIKNIMWKQRPNKKKKILQEKKKNNRKNHRRLLRNIEVADMISQLITWHMLSGAKRFDRCKTDYNWWCYTGVFIFIVSVKEDTPNDLDPCFMTQLGQC